MKIVFFGTPEAAVPSLRALIDAGHAPRLVVTRPDRPLGRSGRPAPPPVKRTALEHRLPVVQPERIRTRSFRESIASIEPELLVVVAYGKLLSPRLLATARHGAINVHFSLLPRYRGAAPVQWALAEGERETGVTTMQLDAGMDEGDLLLARRVTIEADEHAPRLGRRLAAIGSELLIETVGRLRDGTLEPRPQDHARASHAPMLRPVDGELDPTLDARRVEGRIRGFDPWPGVWAARGDSRIRLVSGRALDARRPKEPPGRVVELAPRRLGLVCAAGTVLELERLQPAGRRVLSIGDAINGRQIAAGDTLCGRAESGADVG